ncbi:glycosyl transferase family 28 [Aureimonas fodinaquatilis]|uniref:Glycosyl transferase family 28 n=1 Tax=Aureimonas fodinaquatilis TaxID=2565783 RepID=A0A5B0DR61_9HYPH|nr:glycosyltransferase [Aureimonas fodinaquatilis]KAA0968996.1 glycosyl transferase family 28 [Aureimonas fodinaquatilis]
MRVFIAVTHLLGVGHLARMAALADGLAAAGHSVLVASGGRAAPTVMPGAKVEFVQLLPVHCIDADFTRLYDAENQLVTPDYLLRRQQTVLAEFERFQPDVLITETFPFGRRQLAQEFHSLLQVAKNRQNPPAILASVRDILNPPSRPEKAERADRLLDEFYDGVLVHGDELTTPLQLSWPVGEKLAGLLRYTGYINRAAACETSPVPTNEVVVSGGGGVAGLPLFEAAIAAGASDDVRGWRILIGDTVPEAQFATLVAKAGAGVVVERARPDFRQLLAGAAASISQAGYNTMLDLAVSKVPAILVPFAAQGEEEQTLRAQGAAKAGVAVMLKGEELTAEGLLAAVDEAIALPPRLSSLSLNGIERSIGVIEAGGALAQAHAAAFARLSKHLDAMAGKGQSLRFWWRDDDAADDTAQLHRMLNLREKLGVPLAIAASPRLVKDGLVSALREQKNVCVLMHGLDHRNHAPAGERKQELGWQPQPMLLAALQQGLADHMQRFGAQALSVLVPPWNRIDPNLLPHLSDAGFTGLSVFKPRKAARMHGLAVVNTHCDPIDWKHGGGLVPVGALIDRLIEEAGSEPLGLLTHHLVQDGATWRFVEQLLRLMVLHPAVEFTAPTLLFAADEGEVKG